MNAAMPGRVTLQLECPKHGATWPCSFDLRPGNGSYGIVPVVKLNIYCMKCLEESRGPAPS